MKKIFLSILTLFLSLYAQELKVQANYFESDDKKGKALFKGNVHIKKGIDEINANKVEIFTNKERIPYKYIATGNVTFVISAKSNVTYKGKAQKVIYFPQKKEYIFYTDVFIQQVGTNKMIQGQEVYLDALNGKARAKSGKSKPVIMTFELEEKQWSI